MKFVKTKEDVKFVMLKDDINHNAVAAELRRVSIEAGKMMRAEMLGIPAHMLSDTIEPDTCPHCGKDL